MIVSWPILEWCAAVPNPEHLAKLKEGVESWNEWRTQNPNFEPDLREVDFHGANFHGANLHGANFTGAFLAEANLSRANLGEANLRSVNLVGANLSGAFLAEANLTGADLIEANLIGANLAGANLTNAYLTEANLGDANLTGANLTEANLGKASLRLANLTEANLRSAYLAMANLLWANLTEADLTEADLNNASLFGANLAGANLTEADLNNASLLTANLPRANLTCASLQEANLSRANLGEADLTEADLRRAVLVETNLEGATLTACTVYGVSAWNVRLERAIQSNLVITSPEESVIQVDNLEVAQFVHLLLNNERIRHVIDTITSKVVLILGRFTPERKVVLDAIREELRKRDYLPVLFDFEKPSHRDLTETVSTLAHMARFVIADITDAKSIPQELMAIVPNLPSVPVQPLLLASQREYGMFERFRRYPWVLEPVLYENQEALLTELEPKVITPAEGKANQQRPK